MSYRRHNQALGAGIVAQAPAALQKAAQQGMLTQQSAAVQQSAAAQQAAEQIATLNVGELVGAAKEDPFFPRICSQLDRYRPPPATIPKLKPLVRAWPIVKAPQDKVNKFLDFLTKVQTRRYRLPNGLISLWMESPEYFDNVIAITAGWAPEGENTSYTRGALWIGVGYTQPKSKSQADRFLRVLARLAREHAGISTSEMPDVGAAALGDNLNDEGMLQGAYRSALAMGEFAAFIRTTFTLGAVARPSKEIAAPIRARATAVARAAATMQQVAGLPSQIGAVVAQAKAVEPVQGQAMLDSLLGVLRGARSAIQAGKVAAPQVITDGMAVRDRTLGQMREAILAQAADYINRNVPFQIAREFVRCWTLAQAWRSLKEQIDAMLSDLVAGIVAAQALQRDMPAVDASIKALDDMIEQVEFEKSQLPLDWWQRTKAGLPVWGWMGVGGVTFIGGALVLRKMRKKKSPKPNRRRRRSSRRKA